MKKVIIIVFLMFLVLSIFIHAEKVAVITEVLKPTAIVVDEDQFYINEDTTIFIYSLNDYKLKKKFGKAGEGPEEFLLFSAVYPQPDHLLVNSFGKISYFKKDGTFIKEIKTKTGRNFLFYPLKEGFVGRSRISEENTYYDTVNIFESELKKGKELGRMKIGNPQKKLELLKKTLTYQPNDNKIFVTGEEGFVIDVFDHTGKKLYSITREYERVKFNPKIEELFRDGWKKRDPRRYELLKDKLEFPEFFPEIFSFFIDANKIYVATWKWQKDKIEFFIFDLKGKLLKHQFISFVFQEDGITPFPVTVKDGKIYQLIENEEEDWELHVSKID
ncbi:hypothetical protein ACFLRB_01535 [Acidobacteriota bacterium]